MLSGGGGGGSCLVGYAPLIVGVIIEGCAEGSEEILGKIF